MYLSGIGDNSSVAVPITGSDRMTTGYSPSTMHIDPTTGMDYASETATPAPVTVIVQPASGGMSLVVIAALALVAWYGYKQGWFNEILGGLQNG